jgi:hypothetical protein
VDSIREQLAVAAEAGGEEARVLAQRLIAPLDSAVRLTLLDALAEAAAEITRELAPRSVELRLRGRDPDFVVSPPPADLVGEEAGGVADALNSAAGGSPAASAEIGEGAQSRINLRLSDQLKNRVEQAADREGLSINAWLVRAAAAAVERSQGGPHERPVPRGGQRYTGWAR